MQKASLKNGVLEEHAACGIISGTMKHFHFEIFVSSLSSNY